MKKVYDFTQFKVYNADTIKPLPDLDELTEVEMSAQIIEMAKGMRDDYMELVEKYSVLANWYKEAGDLIEGLKDNKELLETQQEGLTELIYDFIQENGLSSKFYSFLEGKLSEERYYCDIDFLMLDYKDEENK